MVSVILTTFCFVRVRFRQKIKLKEGLLVRIGDIGTADKKRPRLKQETC